MQAITNSELQESPYHVPLSTLHNQPGYQQHHEFSNEMAEKKGCGLCTQECPSAYIQMKPYNEF
tara:strand:+ start:16248 stop:16439 length:192 start_codon:yes stop_codon:yes gene_type:complete